MDAALRQTRWWLSSRLWLGLVLLLALVLRLGAAIVIQRQVDQPPPRLCLISGDAEGYWELARTLVAGEPYAIYTPPRAVLRMPGFPVVLAVPRAVVGENILLVRCWLACLGTLACWSVYELGRLLADPVTGLIAALYTAIAPTLVVFSVLLLSETVFALAMTLSLIAVTRWAQALGALQQLGHVQPVSGAHIVGRLTRSELQAAILWSVLTGLTCGLATYIRPTWLPVLGVFALAVIVHERGHRVAWLTSVLAVGVLCAALAPWTLRNHEVTGHWVPTTLWMGASLYDGWNPNATGDSEMSFFDDERLLEQHSEYEVDQIYRQRAWQWAQAHPRRVAELAVIKLGRYFSLVPNATQFQRPVFWWAAIGSSVPLLCLSAVGLITICRGGVFSSVWFCLMTLGPLLFFAALHTIFVASLRYRLPAEYPLSVLAAVGFVWTLRACARRTNPAGVPASGGTP